MTISAFSFPERCWEMRPVGISSCSGFILSAGFGTRLRPLTHRVPKALIPLGEDRVLADHALSLLRSCGIRKVGMNACHLADQLVRYGMDREVRVFRENPVLGTGGFLCNLGSFFDGPMVVINCDCFFAPGENPVPLLVAGHQAGKCPMTLVLRPADAEWSGTRMETANGRVTAIGAGSYHFTGLYMVSPSILPMVREESILPVMRQLADDGKLGAVIYQGEWTDCGTREGLIRAHRMLSGTDTTVYTGAELASGAVVREAVLYPGTRIASGATVTRSVLMDTVVAGDEVVDMEIRA